MLRISLKSWAASVIPLTVLVLMLAAHFRFPTPIDRARLQVFDAYLRVAPRIYTDTPVRIIDIDETSLKQFGQWPWPRPVLAKLIDQLREAEVAVVGIDIILAEPDRTSPENVLPIWRALGASDTRDKLISGLPSHDELFAQTLASVPTVTGFVLTSLRAGGPPSPRALFTIDGPDPGNIVPRFSGALPNLVEIDASASGHGAFNLIPDGDGITRRLHLLVRYNEQIYPAFGAEVIRVAQRAEEYKVRTDASSQAGGTGIYGLRIGALDVPTDAVGRMWLHPTNSTPRRYISASSILNGDKPATNLSGYIALIGSSAVALKDLRATPLNNVTPGVELHASLIEQVLLGHFLRRPGWAEAAEIGYLLGLSALLLLLMPRMRALGGALVGGTAVAFAVAMSWYAFDVHAMLLDPILPSIAVLIVYACGSLIRFWQTDSERRHVRRAFTHYLAPSVVDQLMQDPGMLKLGGERRDTTFLFTDIAGFTSLTESIEPTALVRLLNAYLDGTTRIVLDHGGTLDKIVGDALHVIFNAPAQQPDHEERAVQCALALDAFCREFERAQLEDTGITLGETRIGVHSGPTVVGNFGGASRFDYTAHGDAINTAARLESLNKHLGTRICISEATRFASHYDQFRPIGRFVLKGKVEPLGVYEPLTGSETGYAPLMSFRHAWGSLEAGNAHAASEFEAMEDEYPDDPIVRFHAARLRAGAQGSVIVMDEK
jgi:adenylate cyclase